MTNWTDNHKDLEEYMTINYLGEETDVTVKAIMYGGQSYPITRTTATPPDEAEIYDVEVFMDGYKLDLPDNQIEEITSKLWGRL